MTLTRTSSRLAVVAAALIGITCATAADPDGSKGARTTPNGVTVPAGSSVLAYQVC